MAGEEKKRYRVQIDFAPAAYKRLAELQELAKVDSNTDLFHNALRLYEWYLKKTAEGYKLGVSKDGERTEVELVLD